MPKENSGDEIVCVHRYEKSQFIKKGVRATPLATEFQWKGNRIPMSGSTSCRVIQTMLKMSLQDNTKGEL